MFGSNSQFFFCHYNKWYLSQCVKQDESEAKNRPETCHKFGPWSELCCKIKNDVRSHCVKKAAKPAVLFPFKGWKVNLSARTPQWLTQGRRNRIIYASTQPSASKDQRRTWCGLSWHSARRGNFQQAWRQVSNKTNVFKLFEETSLRALLLVFWGGLLSVHFCNW